tara:strand:+ start:227 stop:460 length:234 start_codon:yes stop_codon:yes gene_type:complete
MNNYDNHLTLIENYLDLNSHEYQSFDNQIEIYPINKNIIIINIEENEIIITSDKGQYKFLEISKSFFNKLDALLANF